MSTGTSKCEFGWKAKNFELLSIDEKFYKLDDLSGVFDTDSIKLSSLLFFWYRSSVFLPSFKKKLGILSFEDDSESVSMSTIKNHRNLGLYNVF